MEGMAGERRARPRPRRGVRRRGERPSRRGRHARRISSLAAGGRASRRRPALGASRSVADGRRRSRRRRVRARPFALPRARVPGGLPRPPRVHARPGARVTSVAVMCLVVALVFWILGDTAERYFCPVVRTLADRWNLAPATAGVTLLALGNGAPDVFASLAAFTRGDDVFDDGETSGWNDERHRRRHRGDGRDRERGDVRVRRGRRRRGARRGAVPGGPRPFRRDVFCYLAASCATAVVVADGKCTRGRRRRFRRVTSRSWGTSCGATRGRIRGRRNVRGGEGRGRRGRGGASFVGGRLDIVAANGIDDGAANGIVAASVVDGESDRAERTVRRRRDAGRGDRADGVRGARGCSLTTIPDDVVDDDEPTVKTRDVASAAPLAIRASSTTSHGGPPLGGAMEGEVLVLRAAAGTRRFAARSTRRRWCVLVAPLEVARRATIPCGDPKRWNRFYACANAALSPLLLTHLVVSFLGARARGRFRGVRVGGLLRVRGILRVGGYAWSSWGWWGWRRSPRRRFSGASPPTTRLRVGGRNGGRVDAVAFLCSVAWIAAAARELTECLAAIGDAVGAYPGVALGDGAGDRELPRRPRADVATARGGQPTMAVAACFSGPLFNMAVGLGGSFAIATWGRAGGKGGPPPSAHRHREEIRCRWRRTRLSPSGLCF